MSCAATGLETVMRFRKLIALIHVNYWFMKTISMYTMTRTTIDSERLHDHFKFKSASSGHSHLRTSGLHSTQALFQARPRNDLLNHSKLCFISHHIWGCLGRLSISLINRNLCVLPM